MQAAFAMKKRTEMLKPTQPMKFWNESHMINKIIRPVHKPSQVIPQKAQIT